MYITNRKFTFKKVISYIYTMQKMINLKIPITNISPIHESILPKKSLFIIGFVKKFIYHFLKSLIDYTTSCVFTFFHVNFHACFRLGYIKKRLSPQGVSTLQVSGIKKILNNLFVWGGRYSQRKILSQKTLNQC